MPGEEVGKVKLPIEPSAKSATVGTFSASLKEQKPDLPKVAVGASGSGDPGDPDLPREKTNSGATPEDGIVILPDKPESPDDIRFLDDKGEKGGGVSFIGEPTEEIKFIDDRPVWRKLLDRVRGKK